eukprot:SAG25_NODE_324_length_9786_cov_33.460308_7_plen_108_part_00
MDDRLVVAVRVLEGGVQVCHAACDVQRDPPGLHTTRARPNSALIARQQGARAVARYWAIMIIMMIIIIIIIIIILMIISAREVAHIPAPASVPSARCRAARRASARA